MNRDGTQRTLVDLSNKVADTEDIGGMNEVTYINIRRTL